MKNSKSFLDVLILFVINVLLILFDYYIALDYFYMLSSEWYIIVLLFFISAIFINPIISYLIDYYLISKYI